MSRGWSWKSGDYWVICDVCSKQTRASSIKKRWDGLLVCPEDFEHRHPQDLLQVRKENLSVPFSRVEPEDQFVIMDASFYLNDTSLITDDFTSLLTYTRAFSDSTSILDSFTHELGIGFLDSLSVTDGFTYTADFQPGFVDTVPVSDTFIITAFESKTINGRILNSHTLG